MNHVSACLLVAAALTVTSPAQEATPKPARKSMTFGPGATALEGAKPKPATDDAATPKPAASSPKPAAKPAEKAPAKSTPVPAKESASPAIVTSTVPPEPAQIVRAFYAALGDGNIDGAYEGLMKGSKIAERPEEVSTLKAKTKQAIDLFGTIHGYDLVDLKPVGERLMRATYLSLGHELPLRWRFYFYKAEDEWKLIDLRVDDKLTGIFDETAEDNPRP
jgi:hypothetical protein